jgi:hypothetical protein
VQILTVAITGHWIDRNWNLHEALLSFKLLEGSHTGNKLAAEIFETLDAYNIAEKLFCITTDNAANNIKAMKKLATMLKDNKGYQWDWEENHVSCLNHVINIGVDAFLKKIKGLSSKPNPLDEEDKEDSSDDSCVEEGFEDDPDDDDDDGDTPSDVTVANFGQILKKIHAIMTVRVCNIHFKRTSVDTFDLYVTNVFSQNYY